jgi:hypothetical protein
MRNKIPWEGTRVYNLKEFEEKLFGHTKKKRMDKTSPPKRTGIKI